jgi:uncharacterized cupredoxin-like copper-binding protein
MRHVIRSIILTSAVIGAAALIQGANYGWPAAAHTGHTFAAGEPGDPKKPFREIKVEMREGGLRMSFVPDKIEVKLGEQIKFVIWNSGFFDHEFLLDSFAGNAKHKIEMQKNPEMEHDDPNGKRVGVQGTAELLWKFTKRGRFEFACLIPGHYEAGMKGVVVVR